ncbi:hypothetical protein [Timonella sp. A28]|uniref:hypothetical protein n=1 Tax=Timonella sp. A28 TaxID=3442640 RepID=UPI003EBCFD24
MDFLIWTIALIASAIGGYYTTRGVLALAQRGAAHEETQPVADDGGPDGVKAKAGLRGGMWIGLLERTLITGFVITGVFAGVAVVIAIKGLGRYPELNADTSERFIIGTLASLLWAVACGSVALMFFV